MQQPRVTMRLRHLLAMLALLHGAGCAECVKRGATEWASNQLVHYWTVKWPSHDRQHPVEMQFWPTKDLQQRTEELEHPPAKRSRGGRPATLREFHWLRERPPTADDGGPLWAKVDDYFDWARSKMELPPGVPVVQLTTEQLLVAGFLSVLHLANRPGTRFNKQLHAEIRKPESEFLFQVKREFFWKTPVKNGLFRLTYKCLHWPRLCSSHVFAASFFRLQTQALDLRRRSSG